MFVNAFDKITNFVCLLMRSIAHFPYGSVNLQPAVSDILIIRQMVLYTS